MNRWCFCLQVAMREFLLTISIRYQAEFQVMRIKKYKFEEYYLIQYKILRTNIWRVVIKDVNQWMTQATSEKKNSECSRQESNVHPSDSLPQSTTELGCSTASMTTASSWSSSSLSMPIHSLNNIFFHVNTTLKTHYLHLNHHNSTVVWRTERRITYEILEVKRLKKNKTKRKTLTGNRLRNSQ